MKRLFSAAIFYIFVTVNSIHTFEDTLKIPCDTDQQCEELNLRAFKCVENICICQDKKQCQKPYLKTAVTRIGHNCNESFECNINKSFCNKEGKCDCIEKTISSEDKRQCLSVKEGIGSSCVQNVQCSSFNALCENNKCICPPNMHSNKEVCYKNVDIGSFCQRNEECFREFTECDNNTCICIKHYVTSKVTAKCLLRGSNGIFSTCEEDIQCYSQLGFNSMCYKGFCKCKDLYNQQSKTNKCTINVDLGYPCGSHSDCHQSGDGESRLECIVGVCKCKSPFHEDSGYCVQNSCQNFSFFTLPNLMTFIITYAFFYVIL